MSGTAVRDRNRVSEQTSKERLKKEIRPKEGQVCKESNRHKHACTHIHMYMYMYIYMYLVDTAGRHLTKTSLGKKKKEKRCVRTASSAIAKVHFASAIAGSFEHSTNTEPLSVCEEEGWLGRLVETCMSEIHDTVAVCIQTGLSIVSNSNMACIALPRLYVSAKGSYGGNHGHSILPLGAQYFSRGRLWCKMGRHYY